MQSSTRKVVVIGTGGTIAGTAASAADHVDYQSGALGADALVAAVPALAGVALQTQTLARLDSSDMDHATWAALAACVAGHLARADVAGVVVTHGTDTLEETAYFLHRTVAAAKPVVLTAAMRPATALSADGPQNLLDAVTVAREAGARGVVAVLAGRVHGGADLRKRHGYRVDAFGSGDAGVIGVVEDGRLRLFRGWPDEPLHPRAGAGGAAGGGVEGGSERGVQGGVQGGVQPGAAGPWLGIAPADWPAVDIVTSHAGASARTLAALVASGARGIVVAGTGNGSVHVELRAAARAAVAAGVVVRRSSRCTDGGVVGEPAEALPSAGSLTPAQARIELMLDLMPAA